MIKKKMGKKLKKKMKIKKKNMMTKIKYSQIKKL